MMFSDRLKTLRQSKSLTQQEVADNFGIKKSTYSGYETGRRIPDSDTLIALANFFNCSVDYLLGRTEYRVDDELLDVVNELDADSLMYYGNVRDALRARYSPDNALTPVELEYIKKYRALDEHGLRVVDFILEEEYRRCTKTRYIDIYDFPYAIFDDGTLRTENMTRIRIPCRSEYDQADYALRICIGDSPIINSGDIVLIKKQVELLYDEFGLCLFNGEPKFCRRTSDGYMLKNEEISLNYALFNGIRIKCLGVAVGYPSDYPWLMDITKDE